MLNEVIAQVEEMAKNCPQGINFEYWDAFDARDDGSDEDDDNNESEDDLSNDDDTYYDDPEDDDNNNDDLPGAIFDDVEAEEVQ